jgi:glycopeptide antibiotics resistance protein
MMRLPGAIAILGAMFIAFVTLFPFDFAWNIGISVGNIFQQFHHPSNPADLIGNILLFIPFGFGLTEWFRDRGLGVVTSAIAIVLISLGLSLSVEILQVFLPSRSPTLSDLLANSLGGLAGWSIFQIWRATILGYTATILETIYQSLSARSLAILFVGYLAIVMLLSIPTPNASNLSNWDTNFPLVVGNEATGDRDWKGYISQFWISDRALSQAEVEQAFFNPNFPEKLENSRIADYRFYNPGNYRDRAGNLPDLIWKGQSVQDYKPEVASFNSRQWLETPEPATLLSQRIRQSSQFSLGVTLATAQLIQTGPARIISVSQNLFQRNFTLGQELNHLSVRLRTPRTGDNGRKPAIAIPKVFRDMQFHQIIMTYDGSQFTSYIDRVENRQAIDLNLQIPLFGKFSFLWNEHKLYLHPALLLVYKLLYYAIVFIPIGIILSLLSVKNRVRPIVWLIGILGSTIILEILLKRNLANLDLFDLGLSIAIASVSFLLFRHWIGAWRSNFTR